MRLEPKKPRHLCMLTHAQMTRKALLQLRVFRFGFLQDGDVAVGLNSMAIKDLGLSKVLHQHDVRVFELVLTVEKRSAVRGDSQASVE